MSHDFFSYADVEITQHKQFEQYLTEILFDKARREAFYKNLQEHKLISKEDTFQAYFEQYAAERKSFRQDYTPYSIASILHQIVGTTQPLSETHDPSAGTGGLIIAKWWADINACSPFTYHPSQHFYLIEEKADNVIPYLLHNLAMRGINAIVIHGDTLERHAHAVYFIHNDADDYLHFSDIDEMPKNEQVAKEFNILKFI